jgi:hypothetical protein
MRQLVNWFRAGRQVSRPADRRNPLSRPGFELLEDRNLMSVVYGGGPLLQHVQIESVFYGQDWSTNQGLYNNAVGLCRYLNDITQSTFMDLLNEYGCGRGNFEDGVIHPVNPARGNVVDDTEIRYLLDAGIRQGEFDQPGPNQLYVVFTEPDVLVTAGGADSQNQFLGYHDTFYDPAIGPVYYAVIPHPIGNADIPGANYFQQQTIVLSHEVAEACTDPDGQTGWRDPTIQEGEIGDLAVGIFGELDGYAIQAIYSNYYGGPVLPVGAVYLGGGNAAAAGTAQGQPGADSNVFTPLSSPLQESGIAAIASDRTGVDTHADALFAALASHERNGVDAMGQHIESPAASALATPQSSTTI